MSKRLQRCSSAVLLTQAREDVLRLLLPPDELCDWLATVIAKRLNSGENVPEAYMRWLYRVQMIRLGLPGPEVISLTDEDWAAIQEEVSE
jgi:hypothetical protein